MPKARACYMHHATRHTTRAPPAAPPNTRKTLNYWDVCDFVECFFTFNSPKKIPRIQNPRFPVLSYAHVHMFSTYAPGAQHLEESVAVTRIHTYISTQKKSNANNAKKHTTASEPQFSPIRLKHILVYILVLSTYAPDCPTSPRRRGGVHSSQHTGTHEHTHKNMQPKKKCYKTRATCTLRTHTPPTHNNKKTCPLRHPNPYFLASTDEQCGECVRTVSAFILVPQRSLQSRPDGYTYPFPARNIRTRCPTSRRRCGGTCPSRRRRGRCAFPPRGCTSGCSRPAGGPPEGSTGPSDPKIWA